VTKLLQSNMFRSDCSVDANEISLNSKKDEMRENLAAMGLTMVCQFAEASSIVEIYECELNEGKHWLICHK